MSRHHIFLCSIANSLCWIWLVKWNCCDCILLEVKCHLSQKANLSLDSGLNCIAIDLSIHPEKQCQFLLKTSFLFWTDTFWFFLPDACLKYLAPCGSSSIELLQLHIYVYFSQLIMCWELISWRTRRASLLRYLLGRFWALQPSTQEMLVTCYELFNEEKREI